MNEEEPVLSLENQAEVDSIKEELKQDSGRGSVNARIIDNYINYINKLAAERLDKEDDE